MYLQIKVKILFFSQLIHYYLYLFVIWIVFLRLCYFWNYSTLGTPKLLFIFTVEFLANFSFTIKYSLKQAAVLCCSYIEARSIWTIIENSTDPTSRLSFWTNYQRTGKRHNNSWPYTCKIYMCSSFLASRANLQGATRILPWLEDPRSRPALAGRPTDAAVGQADVSYSTVGHQAVAVIVVDTVWRNFAVQPFAVLPWNQRVG